MKKIYLTESKFLRLLENKEEKEVTFYEFLINAKKFLKELLIDPNKATPSSVFQNKNISKNDLIKKMEDLGLLSKKEHIEEVPVSEEKKVAKLYAQYNLNRNKFQEKMHTLYNDIFKDSMIKEEGEGGGATSCGSAMQGGGGNPDAGQYTVPFGKIQRRKINRQNRTS